MKTFKEFFYEGVKDAKEVKVVPFTYYDFRMLLKNILAKTTDKETMKILTQIMKATERLESIASQKYIISKYTGPSRSLGS